MSFEGSSLSTMHKNSRLLFWPLSNLRKATQIPHASIHNSQVPTNPIVSALVGHLCSSNSCPYCIICRHLKSLDELDKPLSLLRRSGHIGIHCPHMTILASFGSTWRGLSTCIYGLCGWLYNCFHRGTFQTRDLSLSAFLNSKTRDSLTDEKMLK